MKRIIGLIAFATAFSVAAPSVVFAQQNFAQGQKAPKTMDPASDIERKRQERDARMAADMKKREDKATAKMTDAQKKKRIEERNKSGW